VSEQQTQAADDPSGDGWRDVEPDEILQPGDMFWVVDHWEATHNAGTKSFRYGNGYRRRIEPQQQSQPEPPAINPDDPSGPDNQLANRIRAAMVASGLTRYQLSQQTGIAQSVLGRFASGERDLTLSTASRLAPTLGLELLATDTSDSEPETMDDLRRRLAECEVLLAEAERSGQQVNAELQQLREQVATLTQERDRLQSWLQQHHTTGQQSAIKKLERWLRPVLELVAEHPEDASPLAVAVLGYLPGIASRLIEE